MTMFWVALLKGALGAFLHHRDLRREAAKAALADKAGTAVQRQ